MDWAVSETVTGDTWEGKEQIMDSRGNCNGLIFTLQEMKKH